MTSSYIVAILTFPIFWSASNAFVVLSSPCVSQSVHFNDKSETRFALSTTEFDPDTQINNRNNLGTTSSELSQQENWQIHLQSVEVQEVREQLVEKYLSLGRSQEYAESEVDNFLNDPNRSQKFLEMRRYAKSQQDAAMGFENILMYGGAFFLGLLGDGIFKYFAAYKVRLIVKIFLF